MKILRFTALWLPLVAALCLSESLAAIGGDPASAPDGDPTSEKRIEPPAGPSRGAQQSLPEQPHASEESAAEPSDTLPIESPAEPVNDKCLQSPSDESFEESIQSGIFSYSCRAVRWFDGLFGSEQEFEEEAVYGRLSLGLAWNQYEGLDPSGRFRLRTELPNVSSKWNAFIGRVDEEDFIRGTETDQDSAFRRGINDTGEPEWLFGLGYKGRKRGQGGWDYSIGVRLRLPPQPYAQAIYDREWSLGRKQRLRYRQTFFVRYNKGYGTTTRLDSAREMSDNDILRWESIATLADYTEGVDWWAAHTWYHRTGPQRGISLRSFIRGRTQGEVPLTEYGFELSWRRQLNRDWLFLNIGPTLSWPRYELEEKRKASWGVAILLDMDFGYFLK